MLLNGKGFGSNFLLLLMQLPGRERNARLTSQAVAKVVSQPPVVLQRQVVHGEARVACHFPHDAQKVGQEQGRLQVAAGHGRVGLQKDQPITTMFLVERTEKQIINFCHNSALTVIIQRPHFDVLWPKTCHDHRLQLCVSKTAKARTEFKWRVLYNFKKKLQSTLNLLQLASKISFTESIAKPLRASNLIC